MIHDRGDAECTFGEWLDDLRMVVRDQMCVDLDEVVSMGDRRLREAWRRGDSAEDFYTEQLSSVVEAGDERLSHESLKELL
jgi:hypothetical protein